MTDELKYLRLLREKFPTKQSAYSEILNLNAILNLPKGTEHFITDIHGEYQAFTHFIKNGSGVVSSKINDAFGDELTEEEKQKLAILICYPDEIMNKYLKKLNINGFNEYVEVNLRRIINVCRLVATKYTKSKVRKALPKEFAYIIEELLYETSKDNKQSYYESIIAKMIDLNQGMHFIKALTRVISRLTIDHLHIVGDIYDRGASPHKILDDLEKYHNVDIQWGNHDVLWMGASSGSDLCIANVIRVTSRYNLLSVITDGYGINLLPLIQFAEEMYPTEYEMFMPKAEGDNSVLAAKIQKAITIIQFKLENEVFSRRPEFGLESRLLLQKVKNNKIEIDGLVYDINTLDLPSGSDLELTKKERLVVKKLRDSFMSNEKLRRHSKFLFSNGSMYKIYNDNLLLHGCIPLNKDGSLMSLVIDGSSYEGKKLLDVLEAKIRVAYFENKRENDYFVYLWQGAASPLFGKKEMKTFERCFIDDSTTWDEPNNPYFDLRENEDILKDIYDEFSLNYETSKMINGHIPVKTTKGESPIKANGKILSIDGGMSKSMNKSTGIGGYTLRYNSYGLVLVEHQAFSSVEKIIRTERDIISNVSFTEDSPKRRYIKSTDIGVKIQRQIDDIERLLYAYEAGIINEKRL